MRTINTERISETEKFIKEFHAKNGRFPYFSEIMEGRKYASRQTLQADIRRLKEKGVIDSNTSEGIKLAESSLGGMKGKVAMIVGTVRCGGPTEAHEDIEGYVILPASIFRGDNLVILKATGDSMTGVQISDGDLLVVRKQPDAKVNDTVIAIMESGESTCKILQKDDNGNYYLEAANPEYQDIHPDSNWCIYGVVQQVIHQM